MTSTVIQDQCSLSQIPSTQQQSTSSIEDEETKEELSSQCRSNIFPSDFDIDE
jgi:hypothetical protein